MPLSISQKDTSRIQFAYYAYIAGPMGDVFSLPATKQSPLNSQGKEDGPRCDSRFLEAL